MFVTQAHSFTQQARLAITLAWVAGYTNILTVITCGTVTSHVSGTASNLGRYVAEASWELAGFAFLLILTFFLGAMASGALTELGRRHGWESIYALPVAVEAVLLAGFALGVDIFDDGSRQTGIPLYALVNAASFAMGLQNATITRISSGVVRTTHITGVVTDLGLEVTQFLLWAHDRNRDSPPLPLQALLRSARVHPTTKRLALLASIAGSFSLGAGLGAFAHESIERWAMFPPVLFLVWLIYRDVTIPVAEIEPSDLATGEHGLRLPAAIAVFHVRKEAGRRGAVHRMPDLQTWAERLPTSTRIVVLDLGEQTAFDSNAVQELRAVLEKFAQHGRKLIIGGVGRVQFQQLSRMGNMDFLDPTNFCPDLELAIARAISIMG